MNNACMVMNHTPPPFVEVERVLNRLPFPVFRMVMTYVQRLPHIEWEAVHTHMSERYCHLCGEYIPTPYPDRQHRHFTCKRRKYEPPHRRLSRYHKKDVFVAELYDPDLSRSTACTARCPVLFYSRQPMYVCTLDHVTKEFVMVQNTNIINTHFNPMFSVIPKMFVDEDNEPLFLDVDESEPLTTFIDRFHQDRQHDVFYWSIIRQQRRRHKSRLFQLCQVISLHTLCHRTRYFLHFHPELEYIVAMQYIGLQNIMTYDDKWARRLLCQYTFILSHASERTIQQFFLRNSRWFLGHLLREHPEVFEYISVERRSPPSLPEPSETQRGTTPPS